jgi:hypothetical protein
MAGHGAEERTLPDTTASEDPDALTLPARQKAVYGPNAGDERIHNVFPIKRARGDFEKIVTFVCLNGALSIDRPAESIDDATEQG